MARIPYQDAFEYFIGSRTRAAIIRRLVTNPEHRVRFYEINPRHPLYQPLKELAEHGAAYTRPFRREKLARLYVVDREGNTPIKRADPRMICPESATHTGCEKRRGGNHT